jgi:phosphohistidine phosphatase
MAKSESLRVTLLRHGLAGDREAWAKQRRPDLVRPLTAKGARRVRQAARGLVALGVKPELILSSPAVRTLQTAKIAAEELGVGARDLHEEPALAPDALPEDFLGVLESLQVREVLCVGHAPHLDEAMAALLGLRHGHGALALKKSGAALLRVRSGQPGGASLRALLNPWALRRLGRRR